MISSYMLAQAFTVVALILSGSAYLSHDDKRLKLLIGFSALAMAAHFFLLEAFTGAGIGLFVALRYFLAIKSDLTQVKWLGGLLLIIYVIIWVYTYQIPADIIALVAGSIGTIAIFYLKHIKMRLVLLTATASWLAYNVAYASYGGVIIEAINIGINIYTIRRMWRGK